ncbi:MAG: tetraacyldisaccharide 4'-kinase, partial [Pseudomonadota bacterium]
PGLRVGVVSRGYGAAKSSARLVDAQSDPATVGDEPVLIATRAKCPVAVGVRRIEAALLLAERDDVDVIVTDDGLQHYALQRDVEIAVVDQRTGLGNGWLLPAGPLREPPWRHETVDYVVTNGDASGFDVMPTGVYRVDGESDTRQIADFSGSRVNAVAGIAQPDKFFALLQSLGMKLNTRVFADHHHFVPTDLQFDNEHDTLMTEKDAVKCKGFAGPEVWALRIDAVLAREWSDDLLRQVTNLVAHYARDRHA